MNIIDYLQWDELSKLQNDIDKILIVDKEKEITVLL